MRFKHISVGSFENQRDLAVLVIEYGTDPGLREFIEEPSRALVVLAHQDKVGWRLRLLNEAVEHTKEILIFE